MNFQKLRMHCVSTIFCRRTSKPPEDYAKYLMDEGDICCVDGITAEFVNFDALGKAMMKENGVALTSLALWSGMTTLSGNSRRN